MFADDASFVRRRRPHWVPFFGAALALVTFGAGLATSQALTRNDTIAGLTSVFRMNAGGDTYTDVDGQVWQGDQFAQTTGDPSTGGEHTVQTAITGSRNDLLFQSQRWGMTGYRIPMANDTYRLRLMFAEVNPSSGRRVFDVRYNGTPWLKDFEISEAAGGDFTALWKEVNVEVTNGVLQLDFVKKLNYPTIAGIELLVSDAEAATQTSVETIAPAMSAARSNSPSGVSMPTGDVDGWRLQWADDFIGTSLGTGWGAYNTQYSPNDEIPSMPGGAWRPNHVTVANGKLNLATYFDKATGKWTSGGLMNTVGGKTTYGKYEVRFRMDKANGVKYALLLWPQSGVWPRDGEIDFAEDGGGQRGGMTSTVIYTNGDAMEGKQQIQRSIKTDFSQWHTVGVEWEPGKLTYTLDGASFATVTSAEVPSGPMNLALQTEAGSCNAWITCIDSTTPTVTNAEFDWVAVYTRN